MANTLRIKRRLSTGAAGAPTGLLEGELAVNFADKKLYIQGDNGILTMPDKDYVDTAITSATGSLGTMSTQNADSVAITGGAIDGTAIGATTPSTGKFTTLEATSYLFVAGSAEFAGATTTILNSGDLEFSGPGGGMVLGLRAPSNGTDAANKNYVDSAVTSLGSVFRFVGDVSQATGNDLDTLPDTTAGAYYRVDVAGVYTAMVAKTQSFDAKVGDAFVQTTDGWQKLDNVDAEVLGTANEIVVTGDENAGYTVAIDPVFSGRVYTAEAEIDDLQSKTQNIDLAGTTAGTTKMLGSIGLVADSSEDPTSIGSVVSRDGFKAYASAGDNYFSVDYNNGIVLGPQYNSWSVQVRNKLEGVEKNGSLPTIENFVIDGGSF